METVRMASMKATTTQLGGMSKRITMSESQTWAKITAYMAENKIKMALEANAVSENMAIAATDIKLGKNKPELQKLDCIYDYEPL